MTRGEIDLIPSKLKARRKLSLNLGTHKETMQEYLYNQIETDRSVQVVWCEYAWKPSVNSKGGTLSLTINPRLGGRPASSSFFFWVLCVSRAEFSSKSTLFIYRGEFCFSRHSLCAPQAYAGTHGSWSVLIKFNRALCWLSFVETFILFCHHLHCPSSSAYFPTFHPVTPNKTSSTIDRRRS